MFYPVKREYDGVDPHRSCWYTSYPSLAGEVADEAGKRAVRHRRGLGEDIEAAVALVAPDPGQSVCANYRS